MSYINVGDYKEHMRSAPPEDLRRWLYGQASRSMQRPDISSAEN